MVCNIKVNSMTDSDVLEFLKNTGCSTMQFELLRFVGKHSKAKLSFYTIAKALCTGGVELGDALTALIEKNILADQYDDNGLTTYSLSADRQIYEYVCELANLDWVGAMNIKKQLKGDLAFS